MFRFDPFRLSKCVTGDASPYAFDWPQEERREILRPIYFRPDAHLPFYCHPVKLFVLVWVVMLASLAFRISYSSYPHMELPVLLFGASVLSLLCGYVLRPDDAELRQSAADSAQRGNPLLNVSRLRRLNWLFVAMTLAIMLVNLKLDGLPPLLGLFSFDTKIYLDYGRMKQVLFPLLIIILVNGSLDPSRLRKMFFFIFALGAMLLYITRGEILAALLQTLFVFSMTTRLPRRKLIIAAAVTVVGLALLANVIGNNRTAQEGFLRVLDIRGEFWDWPMIALWVISYFSIPLSNLCWIVRDFHFHKVTFSFLYQVLPAFWFPNDPHESIQSNSHIVDGVHTYLGNYFMDFSFAGIVLANVALGAACAYVVRRGISRNFLTSAVFFACVANIFFNDNFTPLSTLIQLAIQAFVQRYVIKFAAFEPMGGPAPLAV